MKEPLMGEIYWDELLNIETKNTREWHKGVYDYHRLEATNYQILVHIMNEVTFNPNDVFVDFGCGNGRVVFYVNYQYKINVNGIELHPDTFKELEENRKQYLNKHGDNNTQINLHHTYAEQYEIAAQDTIFYFFNPFSLQIFRQVISNLIQSIQLVQRKVQIILYYPQKRYRDFLETHTPFKESKRINIPWTTDYMDYAIIYENQID